MQEWEYIEVTAPMRDDGKSVRIYLNGEETLPESRSSALYDYLNKLGRDGWEMVNFAFYPNKTAFYYFKRPVKPRATKERRSQRAPRMQLDR